MRSSAGAMHAKLDVAAVKFTVLAVTLLWCAVAAADDEASNTPRVFASRYGQCYAKSIPAELYGDKGVTRVFRVEADRDTLVHTYDWFAPQLFLECNVGAPGKSVAIAVARTGPWLRGDRATSSDLVIAFYWDGRLLEAYSALDIAGSAQNVSASESHYTVLSHIGGYRWTGGDGGNEYVFEARGVDGTCWEFDAATGASRRNQSRVVAGDAQPPPCKEGLSQ